MEEGVVVPTQGVIIRNTKVGDADAFTVVDFDSDAPSASNGEQAIIQS